MHIKMEDTDIISTYTTMFKNNGFIDCANINSNNSKVIAISDLPPSEAAVSVDHILKIIFSQLNTTALKEARLVSSRWKEFGAGELRKRVSIPICFYYKLVSDDSENYYYSGDQYIRLNGNIPSSIEPGRHGDSNKNQNPSSSVSLHNLITSAISASTNFPCDSFAMTTETLSSPQIQEFLSVAGPLIKKLRLLLVIYAERSPTHDSPIMTQLKTLLMTQCPHLERTELQIELRDRNLKKKIKKTGEMDFISNFSKSQKIFLPHLKYFTLRSEFPFQFFTQIMDSAVNLKAYYGLSCSHYFTEERNGRCRVHLLTQLHFELSVGSESGIVNHILCQHKSNLRLGWIRVTISKVFFTHEYSISTWRHFVKAVHILNDLLDTSRKTLKKLTIPSLRTLPGLRIPHMPKIEGLVLLPPQDSVHSSFDKQFFPPLINVLSLFPSLSSISIVSLISEISYDSDVRTLFNVDRPMPGVRLLRVAWPNCISLQTRNIVYQKFPNCILEQLAEEDWNKDIMG